MTEVWVECSDRGLTAFPDDFPQNTTSLDLSSNDISKIISSDLSGLSKLRYLHIRKNCISHVSHGAFGELAELLELELDRNKFMTLTDNMFQGLWKLTVLSLEENHMTHISALAFESLISLQTVKLNYNNLRMADIRPILQLPNLRELFLENNDLTSFYTSNLPFNTSKLRTLSIIRNYIQRFSISRDIFPHLHSVHLSGPGGLKWDVPDPAFLRSLTVLDLHMVDISYEMFKRILKSAESLQTLALSKMTNKQVVKPLVQLSCQNPAVTTLDLSENEFVRRDDTFLYSCSHLTELDLSLNNLQDMSESALKSMKQLRYLELSKNHLKRVPLTIRGLSTLQIFNLSSNFISELTCSDFLNLISLTELYLN